VLEYHVGGRGILMKEFELTEQEQTIHKILNSSAFGLKTLDIEEMVREIAQLNFAISLLDGQDFIALCRNYKNRLLKHIEDI
jgi:hypothetical protein